MDGMTLFNDILFWLHLTALVMAGGATFGIPVIAGKLGTASAETRPVLYAIIKRISTISRAALVILLVTGPLLVWLKYGGTDGFTFWFWIKMALVLILLIGVIYSGILGSRTPKGDAAAIRMAPRVGIANTVVLLLIILTAVFEFG